jgi:hypothetical protein
MGYELNTGNQYFITFTLNNSDKNNQHKIALQTETARRKMYSIDYKLAEESNFLDNISAVTFDPGKQNTVDMAATRGSGW